MVNGKATLLRDDYCDGLGDCLPTCPTDAITFVEREAAAYDEAAVKANMAAKALTQELPCGCPGSAAKALHPHAVSESKQEMPSQLGNWPVQLMPTPLSIRISSQAASL